MNPSQFTSATGVNLSSIIPETSPVQIPKIEHILYHAKHPELSRIYANPEFQTTLSQSGIDESTPMGKESTGKNKKTKIKLNRAQIFEKKNPNKMRKNQIYQKYYLDDEARMKKATPIKKVSLGNHSLF